MTLDEFKNLPSTREDFPKVAGAIDLLLVDHLIATCAGAKGVENAAAEVGAAKAIANIINFLRYAADSPRKTPKKITMKPLRRFSDSSTDGQSNEQKP